MSQLFTPLKLREIVIPNRIFMSPMCQYSSSNGKPQDWHLVHYGSRAVGKCGLVVTEATAVTQEGRISPDDLGIWSDEHAEAFIPIVDFIKAQGSIAGIQLAHAGRKASVSAPWLGGTPLSSENRGWQSLAPSPIPFMADFQTPREATIEDLDNINNQFSAATRRSLQAGFQVVELHAAHGYLLHQFLSPLSNHRTDEFGGSLENRMRFPLRIAKTVRDLWPENLPMFVRISTTDWVDGGWDVEQSLEFCRQLKKLGIDLIDCSSGGLVADAVIPVGPGFQTPMATEIKSQVKIKTAAVGLITEPAQAEQIIVTGLADAVFLGRELLRDPYWPLHAAQILKDNGSWPAQYERAKV
ncbi:NADH:flavin oxidoreductase/NADH oxidase [uncultured Desulfuromusa sp.]|uniref:NADH:flavin oxidoreductase/NADH oxidase n=1 Tax=uncultured Desulfuromusa sp. TaxID=219183 RepID=UPI002AA88F10|nr:NADH:flavin oxidoreductase/NADH oxidase [uncultured Desulfuromusa sp.]